MAALVGNVSVKASLVLILAAGMDSYSCYCVWVPLFETSGLPKIYKETKSDLLHVIIKERWQNAFQGVQLLPVKTNEYKQPHSKVSLFSAGDCFFF